MAPRSWGSTVASVDRAICALSGETQDVHGERSLSCGLAAAVWAMGWDPQRLERWPKVCDLLDTAVSWPNALPSAPALPAPLLSIVRKWLTQFSHIIMCQAPFVSVTVTQEQTRGIRVYWSRKMPKMFTPAASSLHRIENLFQPCSKLVCNRCGLPGTLCPVCNERTLTIVSLRPGTVLFYRNYGQVWWSLALRITQFLPFLWSQSTLTYFLLLISLFSMILF